MPKILLIQTTQYSSDTDKPCKQKRLHLPGLTFPLLVRYIPDHWEIETVIEVIEDINYDSNADIVGIGAMGHAILRAVEIAKVFKSKGKTVFFGGYMASIMPDFVKPYCDSIIIGDAEISLPRLLNDFESTGTISPIYDEQLKDLNGLKLPKYELILEKPIGYLLPVQAARGCPHTCLYCSIACVYKGRYLTRPVDDVIRDIKRVKELGYKRFYLMDDNILGKPDYLMEFAEKLKPLKMTWASQCTINIAKNDKLLRAVYDSGCRILSIGVESFNQEGLNKLKKSWVNVDQTKELIKRIQKVGIVPATEMIIGIDGDTVESIRSTAEFVKTNHIQMPKFYILTPYPGSELYLKLKANGRLLHENYRKYTGTQCVYQPIGISPEELDNAYNELNRQIFSLSSILRRTLFNPYFLKSPLVHLFAFFANMEYRRYVKRGDAPNIF